MTVGAAAITGGLNLAGSILGSGAAKESAKIQAESADRATALQRQMFDIYRQDQAPFRETGLYANQTLRDMLPALLQYNPQLDPGYLFGQREGEKGISRALARSGGMDSGATLKALLRFNQDYANTKYTDALNREMAQKGQQYNFLAGLTGAGQAATNQVGTAGMNFGAQAGNNMTSGAAARAAGLVGASNAWQGGLNNTANNLMTLSYLSKMPGFGSGGGAVTPQAASAAGTPFGYQWP